MRFSAIRRTLRLFPACFALALPAVAAPGGDDSAGVSGWEARWRARAEAAHNDNVFKLSPSQESLMALGDPASAASGRFRDMESANDVVLDNAFEVEIATKEGLFGRTLEFDGTVAYSRYLRNAKKSHVDFELSASQKVSKRGRVKLRSAYTPNIFTKNYLADATDLVDRVTPDERIYREGVSSEWNVVLAYRHQFPKGAVDATGGLSVSYRNRSYREPFAGRDEEALGLGLDAGVELARGWNAELSYAFEPVKSPVTAEVLLLDEPDYIIDFNNDRDFADKNIRTVRTIDRSHRTHVLSVGTAVEASDGVTFTAGAGLLWKGYTSRELIDPAYKDRDDHRTTLMLGFDYKIVAGVHCIAEFRHITQKTNRLQDPDYLGEITDYEVNILRGGLSWRF